VREHIGNHRHAADQADHQHCNDRQRLRKQLEDRPAGCMDAGPTMQMFDEELRVIETALANF